MIVDFNRYLKRATTIGFAAGIVLVSVLFVTISWYVWGASQERQIRPWLKIFPQNVLTHLVESDYHPISSKIRLVQETNLFDEFAVFDKNLEWIDGFGRVQTQKPLRKELQPILDESGNTWGWFMYRTNSSEQIFYVKLISSLTVGLILFIILAIQLLFNKLVATKVARFSDLVKSIDVISHQIRMSPETLEEISGQLPGDKAEFREAQLLNSSISNLITVIRDSRTKEMKSLIEAEKGRTFNAVATQVAHDIRSPLEVLKGLKDEIANLPEASKKRLQLSILRIEEITFNLLKTHKQTSGIDTDTKSEELLSLIASVVTEKNIEYRNYSKIEIEKFFDSNSYGLFSKIQRSTFKSIISNLINNGIESTSGQNGVIEVSLTSIDSKNIIKISDNGQGITPAFQDKLFSKGFTTKKNGNGLGLFNAKQDIEAVGGTIEFDTELGKGTTFIITLPKSERPSSFIDSIDTFKYERIIVLDDDPAFHEVWNKRLEGLEDKIEHIHSVEEMLTKYQALHPKILLLSDFELMDKNLDGIESILKLGHSEHSVLVTARSEEQAIQDRCLIAGIKLLPKSLVNYVKVTRELSGSSKLGIASMVGENVGSVPFTKSSIESNLGESKLGQVEESQGGASEAYNKYVADADFRSGAAQIGSNQISTIVLIDDDRLVHINWSGYCKKNGVPFFGFKSIDDFLAGSSSFDKASRIFIDSNLGDGIKGEVESEKIFNLGFLNLYLATGYEKDSIQKPTWIREVFSKSPENIS